MTRKKLLKMLEKGENLNIEFKQRFSSFEKIAKEMIAFANTNGGHIIFGIDDDGSVYGVESEKGEAEFINESAIKYCEPPVDFKLYFIELEKKEVVVVEIVESNNKPHRVQDYLSEIDIRTAQVYVRVGEKSVLASKEMIKILQSNTSNSKLKNYNIGKNEKIVFEYLDDNEIISVKELSNKANISLRRASRTLINLVRANLLLIHSKENGEDYFTYAGDRIKI